MGQGCEPCNNGFPKSFDKSSCSPKPSNCSPIDSTCVNYTGANFTCLENVPTNPNLEEILLAIDAKVCETGGSWAGFDYHCLDEAITITSPSEFVDVISDYVCTLRNDFDTFTTVTYPSGLANLQTQINSIVNPNLTLCSGSGIISSDNYSAILTKLANNICSIKAEINVSGAIWDSCFSTDPTPTTVTEGFDALISQICQLQAEIGTPTILPTFNNIGSCLPSPLTATDSLVDTINKIKTRLCQTGTINIDSLPWGCVTNPTPGNTTNLQGALNSILTQVNTNTSNIPTFDTDQFVIVDNGCNGKEVSIAPDFFSDRLVASDSLDTTPGTLVDKLDAGTNITLDNTTTPGKLIINANSGTDELVKASSTDPSAGYLVNKVNGVDPGDGISITTTNNAITNKVDFTPNIDWVTFITNMLTQVESDPTLYNLWCNLNCGCEPCGGQTTSTSTTIAPAARVALVINNQSSNTVQINTVLTQNNPTLGILNNSLTIPAQSQYNSGWYNLTTTITNPITALLNISNPDNSTYTYDIAAVVLQPNNSTAPASSSIAGQTLGVAYNNPNFSLGSVITDLRLQITITNYVQL